MTLADLLKSEDLRRHEFPVARDRIYLAHAGVAPLPRRVVDALRAHTGAASVDDQESALPEGFFDETRALAARLLAVSPEEIAFIGPTSNALSTVAAGLDFGRHDNVLVYFDDYPSNVYPWMALGDRGVEVRFLNVRELGRIRPQDVLGQVDEGTRLVAVASAHFLAGYRVDIETLGRALRARNILCCVDGIQTLGAFPTTGGSVDFLAADAHKWLLGPCAAGLLYVRRSVQDRLRPTSLGWHNVRCPGFVAQETLTLRPDARRYEAGTQNLLGLVGLRAALALALEIGIPAIAEALLRKRHRLLAGLGAKGYQVLQAEASPEQSTGIVTFRREGLDLAGAHRDLAAAGVVSSLRLDRQGRQYLRFSPHYYNTDSELDRAVALLPG